MTEDSKSVEEPYSEGISAPVTQTVAPKDYDKRRRALVLTAIPLLLLTSLIVSIPIAFTFRTPDIAISLAVFATIGAEILALAFAVWFGKLTPLKDFLYLRVHKWWHIPAAAVAGVLGYLVLQLGATGVTALIGETIASSNTSTQLGAMEGIQGVLFLVGVVALLGPLVEEFYFRGFIIGALQHSKWNKAWISLLISGLTFGVLHIQGFSSATDVFILFWTIVMGVFFAWLVLKTQSIWTSVAAHVAYNMVTAVLLITGFEG